MPFRYFEFEFHTHEIIQSVLNAIWVGNLTALLFYRQAFANPEDIRHAAPILNDDDVERVRR